MAQLHPLGLERYLLPISFREVPSYRFDVVVVGSGVAGACAALSAAARGANVALIAKDELGETNTVYAQGGVAAVLSRVDSFAAHIQDTLKVG
ncbi:MAG: FAD-dependent oxidoreductase, partial [Planctomycetia bacterium]